MSETKTGHGTLFAGGMAAILASTCCLGSLVLITLGFSGAWISNLTVLESYRPFFLGTALVALFFAWRRIYRSKTECKPDEICVLPQTKRIYRITFWIVVLLVLIALTFPYIAPLFY